MLPTEVEICPVALPGRGARLHETPLDHIEPLVTTLADEVTAYSDRPYALFGHSMGALIAFELAHRLGNRAAAPPVALFVSGRRPPHVPEANPHIRHLSDDELVAVLQRRYHRIAAVLDASDARAVYLPALRADFCICETYQPSTDNPLSYPIVGYGGKHDQDATVDELLRWRRYTTAEFELTVLPGGHFFTEDSAEVFLTQLARDLSRVTT
jgi:medium-chain acyl-[acyl-carrier-protein] hydrolase